MKVKGFDSSQRQLRTVEEFCVRIMKLENSLQAGIWMRHNKGRNQGNDSGESELESDMRKMETDFLIDQTYEVRERQKFRIIPRFLTLTTR